MTYRCLVFLAALAAPFSIELPAQSVQLRDGSILVGEVQNPTGEGFTLLRSDNGGVLELRWSHLTSSSAKLLRERAGLLNTKDDEVTVRADVVRFEGPTGRVEEMIGIIVKKDGETIHLRRGRDVTPIRRSMLRGLAERQVPPHDIYTVSDYYTDLLAKAAPGEDADKHLALGEQLMRVRDYDNAELHMKKAEELGGGRQPLILKQRLQRLALLKNSAEERKLLDEIRTYTNRRRFEAAAERIAQFKSKFQNSELAPELTRLEENFGKARRAHLGREVARRWYGNIARLAAAKVGAGKAVTLAAARAYAEREMGREIRTQIGQALGIEVTEVEDLWANRFEMRVAKGQHYHYSVGSWLLGPAAVLKGTQQGKAEEEAKKKEESPEQKKIDEGLRRIREALKRSRQARRQRAGGKGAAGQKKQVTPEDWWKSADRNQKITWLKAFYAEFSGDMKMTSAHLTPCSHCGGAGSKMIQGSVGQAQREDCAVCRRTRFKRDIRAR